MNINFLSKAIAPLAAVAALSMAAPASAAVFFGNGDTLNITGGYKDTATTGLYKFTTLSGGVADVGSYGNFGVTTSTSTGAFIAFGTDATKAGYEILSLDFNDVATYVGKTFLSLTKGADAFTFTITGLASKEFEASTPTPFGTFGGAGFSFDGVFKSLDDQTIGKGILVSSFFAANGGYAATLFVTEAEPKPVPEPSALLGIGLMVGAVYVIRRRQVAIA